MAALTRWFAVVHHLLQGHLLQECHDILIQERVPALPRMVCNEPVIPPKVPAAPGTAPAQSFVHLISPTNLSTKILHIWGDCSTKCSMPVFLSGATAPRQLQPGRSKAPLRPSLRPGRLTKPCPHPHCPTLCYHHKPTAATAFSHPVPVRQQRSASQPP